MGKPRARNDQHPEPDGTSSQRRAVRRAGGAGRPQEGRGGHRGAGAARQGRGPRARRRPRLPLRLRHRAVPEQAVVRQDEAAHRPAVEAVRNGRVQFVPAHYENVYYHWMEKVRDWGISRQLWWATASRSSTARLRQPVVRNRARAKVVPALLVAAHSPDPDVLDTWFSSACGRSRRWAGPTRRWSWRKSIRTTRSSRRTRSSSSGRADDHHGMKFMGDIPFSKVVINRS